MDVGVAGVADLADLAGGFLLADLSPDMIKMCFLSNIFNIKHYEDLKNYVVFPYHSSGNNFAKGFIGMLVSWLPLVLKHFPCSL